MLLTQYIAHFLEGFQGLLDALGNSCYYVLEVLMSTEIVSYVVICNLKYD